VWEPLFARYDAPRVLDMARKTVSSGHRSLQSLLGAIGAAPLALAKGELDQLRDWDRPEDVLT
jgi:hypothetical protein